MLSATEIEIILLSLKVAVWSVLASLPFAIAVAHVLARRDCPGKSLADAVVHLPLVLPPVVIGYFLLILLGRRGPLGAWLEDWFGVVVAFRWTGAAIACAVMGFPLMVRAIRLSIDAIDPKLEAAAQTLGAGHLGAFLTITLPLALPGILTGILHSFARFALEGRGTPAPVAPTETLVVSGQYRYVRNPMYVAVVGTVVGQALLFGSLPLVWYALALWVLFHAFVLAYEEPTLARTYGASYARYRTAVNRWLPRPPRR